MPKTNISVSMRFTYECGCKGKMVDERVEICCPKHGDMVQINGESLNLSVIRAESLDLLINGDAKVPAFMDFRNIPLTGRKQLNP